MKKIKIIILGTINGVILSIGSLGMAYIAASLFTGALNFPAVLIISTLTNGAILGSAGISLSYLSSGLEHRGLILLISLGVASLTVLIGNYDNGSILPVAIYLLAISNGLLISRMTVSRKRFEMQNDNYYLQS